MKAYERCFQSQLAAWMIFLAAMIFSGFTNGQEKPKLNDTNTSLHILLKPEYPVPYGKITPQEITEVLLRVYNYLEPATPFRMIDSKSRAVISDYSVANPDAVFEPGDFRLVGYEWGVTYAGMLLAGEVTGDSRFSTYTTYRMQFLAQVFPFYKKAYDASPAAKNPLRSVAGPRSLDDAGSMCAAMIKTLLAEKTENLRPMVDNYINHISNVQFRLADGTLARNFPYPNTLWLDDLFMSVPALAQMGKLTGDSRYFDDAVKQVLQFSERMFVPEKGLYMHGWVQEMEPHRAFHWARANGWAFMAMAELLDVLPENHPGKASVLKLFQEQAKGLAGYQSGSGFWHQLIDRNDSYMETSATAIYSYCYAKGINRGWLDLAAYGPVAQLAWIAVSTKVNEKGQVEGTCVGTGMGFDPAFYYYRPVSEYAAHGYGPVLLAGAEMIRMINSVKTSTSENALKLYK